MALSIDSDKFRSFNHREELIRIAQYSFFFIYAIICNGHTIATN